MTDCRERDRPPREQAQSPDQGGASRPDDEWDDETVTALEALVLRQRAGNRRRREAAS